MTELVIHGANTITPQGIRDVYVLIEGGKIADVVEQRPEAFTGEMIEAGEKILMAGVIDPHVHINEPGRTDWEGFDTATKAAIAGGVTMLVDMPLNSSPVTTTVKAFEDKLAATVGKIYTNIGFWGGVIPGNESEIQRLIENGVLGFKAFLTHSGIDEFPNVTERDLRKVMPVIAKSGLPLLVHCELTDERTFVANDKHSYKEYVASRPKRWEDDAITLMIRLCEEFDCRTHIVHLSSAGSIGQIEKAKRDGLPLTVETAQHYLYFNAEDVPDGQTQFKCAPPIRERENNERLWQALKDGIIDFVATDHSPAPPALKEIGSGDLVQAWGGIASIQFALPVLWTAAKQHQCSVEDVSKWLCSNPAKLVNQKKGLVQKGYDADFVIWDPSESFTVSTGNIYHRHKITPYLNENLSGVVVQTFLAGKKVYDNGTIDLQQGKIILNNASPKFVNNG
jgi:allantoinase